MLLIIAGAAWYTANNLKLNNDLASLLPENTPSVKALNESTERFGSSDKFLIAIRAEDPQIVAELQDSIQKHMLADWKDILISAQIERDNQFFVDHALLYLPVEHLERIRDNLGILQREMSDAINPFLVDLSDEDDQKTKAEDLVWFDASIPQELGLPDEAADAFSGFYKKKDSTQSTKKKWDPKAALPEHLKNRLIGQHKTDLSWNGLIQCKLTGSSTDLNFTERVLARADSLLSPYRAKYGGQKVYIEVRGSYEGLKDVEKLKGDGYIATAISIILILFVVIAFFRSILAAFILVFQVLFAAILMLFFTALFYGQLNPYTLFVAAIIIGMGIDFAIHMMGVAQRFNADMPLADALEKTIHELLSPMALAAITTIAGLLTLLIADFRGFYEFGVIASVGVGLSLLSSILGLPVLLTLIGGLPKIKQNDFLPRRWSDDSLNPRLQRYARSLMIVILLSVAFFPWAEFEHNFRNLRPPKTKEDNNEDKAHTGVALETKRKSSQPAAVLGNNPEELNRLYDTLMVRLHQEKDPMLASFLTLKTFVPTEDDQEERLEVIEEINDMISARVFNKVKGDDSLMVEKLRRMSEVEAFSAEEIPVWALDLLKEKNGSYGNIGFIYGRYKSWDAREMHKFQERFGHWNFGGEDLRVFSSAFITSDVIQSVKKDSAKMGVFIFIVLMLTLTLVLRDKRLVLISILPLSAGILLTIGLMGLTNLTIGLGKITMFNVIVIPMVLGVGIDATIHLLHSATHHYDKGLRYLYNTTGRMVAAASMTTISGFLGMLFIEHKGLRTIGEIAVISIFASFITAMIFTPWLARKFYKKK
jgi:predicted RND superfamily exporter protein